MPKILLIEDDLFIAEIYEKKLSSSGFEVDSVISGREALKKLTEGGHYDLVLLDLVLPEMSGMEVLREIKGKPSEYGDVKVVIFSNLSGPDDRQQTVHAGADGFISKTDFTPAQVVEEVERFLKQFSEQMKNAKRLEETPSPELGGEKRQIRKIFFIEDEEIFVEMFGKRLRDEGYVVITENNGKNGLDRALTESFDLIITDIMLPGMEGSVIVEKLRANPGTKDIPIFIFTASLEEEELKKLQVAQAINRTFLKTQVTPSELVDAVNEYFGAHP